MKTQSRQLRIEPSTVVDVPFQVLENAFWRPQAAKLCDKHRGSLKSISGPGAEKSYQKLRVAWRREETWINHALNALLASVPDLSLGRVLGEMNGGEALAGPVVSTLDSGGIASTTGAPDFIVMGEKACVLGETKVAAQPTSARYSFQQFTKYQTLAAILTCARAPGMRRSPTHLLVVPEIEPQKFCSDSDQWRPQARGHRLVVDAKTMKIRDPKGRFSDFATWSAYVRKTLLDKRVLSRCDLDTEKVERLMAADSPCLVPTYVVTWAEMMGALSAVAKADGLRNLGRAAARLEAMAYGRVGEEPEGDRLDRFVGTAPVKFLP